LSKNEPHVLIKNTKCTANTKILRERYFF